MVLSALGTIGSVTSGLGSIASAFGLGGNDGPSPTEQINHNANGARRTYEKVFHGQMNMARKYGLHPLTVLGQGTSTGRS